MENSIVAIIDDEVTIQTALGSLIRSLGKACHLYSSAEEFLQALPKTDYACVLTDLNLPNMSGQQLQAELLQHAPQLPVFLITAHYTDQLRQQMLSAGFKDVFAKPFCSEALIKALDSVN